MHVHCSDCDHTFLLTPEGATQHAACPQCGGDRLERDQPSPTHSDGDLRNMVNPDIGLDQGGNPNQEGIWAQVDGGWQPAIRRDESFASVKTAEWGGGDMGFDFGGGATPTHKFIIDGSGKVHSAPEPVQHEDIAINSGLASHPNYPKGLSLGGLNDDGTTEWYQHESPHSPQAMESMLYGHFGHPVTIDPSLKPTTNEERWFGEGATPEGMEQQRRDDLGDLGQHIDTVENTQNTVQDAGRNLKDIYRQTQPEEAPADFAAANPELAAAYKDYAKALRSGEDRWVQHAQQEIQRAMHSPGQSEQQILQGPSRPRRDFWHPWENEGLVRGGSVDRTLNMEPYMPWTHEAEVKEADLLEGPQHHATVTPGPQGIHAGTVKWLQFLDARVNGKPARQAGPQIIMEHGMRNSPQFGVPVQVSVHHPEHLPGAINTIETSAQGSVPPPVLKQIAQGIAQGAVPAPPGIDPTKLRFGSVHIAGPALAIGGEGLMGMAGGALMRGALMGTGSSLVKGVMGGGAQDASGQQPSMPEQPRDLMSMGKVADLETPHTTPYLHDSPDGDNHQFDDGDHDPNPENPNLNGEAGGSQLGEDGVPTAFSPNSPGLERMQLLAPLLLHYYHSPESGEHDPLIKGLHDQLESEVPGYLDQVGDEHEHALRTMLDKAREPSAVSASTHEAFGPGAGVPAGQPGMVPGGIQPIQGIPPAGGMPGGGGAPCPYCGGVTTEDGSCPQCGAKANPMGGAVPGGSPGGLQAAPNALAFGTVPRAAKMAADHQGPVTDEQKAAVSQLLIQQGRSDEIPDMLQQPWLYAKELAAVANKVNTAPNVDPNEQPPPAPAQEVAPPGATMPVPGMASPQAPTPYTGKTATPHPGAPRCPKCNSATTGFVNDGTDDLHCECHSCGNFWSVDGGSAKIAADDPNVVAAPEADQQGQPDPERDQDSSQTWQTDDGQPLQIGQEYEMHSPGYSIPDIVKIEQIKPDALVVSTIGEYGNQGDGGGDALSYKHEIKREEAQLEGLTFTPSDGNSQAGDQSLQEYDDRSQAPVNTEPQPTPDTHEYGLRASVEKTAPMSDYDHLFGGAGGAEKAKKAMQKQYGDDWESVFYALVNKKRKQKGETKDSAVEEPEPQDNDDSCPKCGSDHASTHMSSATTEFHECFRCGHGWETREEDYHTAGAIGAEWILHDSGPGGEDFFSEMERHRAMRESGNGSRSLADIARRDNRLQEIKDRLENNKMEREAGKKYTPHEQREFVNERGVARNADKLDLEGTHYESHRYLGPRANGENVRDEELFLGL
jgi:DNA-directed RNA polymerase subunit M/transcription elongation factor TFIIS